MANISFAQFMKKCMLMKIIILTSLRMSVLCPHFLIPQNPPFSVGSCLKLLADFDLRFPIKLVDACRRHK